MNTPTKVWSEVTRNGVLDRSRWLKLTPIDQTRIDFARRIYREHGAQARGEPYGEGDNTRAANGTVAEAQFADHYGLPWSGGVTVADPRSVIADVGDDIQVYTSYAIDGRLIVHADELVDNQRWVHLTGVAPDDLWFVGWISAEDIAILWPMMANDPRQTGGKVFPQQFLKVPGIFNIPMWCGVCEGENRNCVTCDGKSRP